MISPTHSCRRLLRAFADCLHAIDQLRAIGIEMMTQVVTMDKIRQIISVGCKLLRTED
jgi:hypothetical protein